MVPLVGRSSVFSILMVVVRFARSVGSKKREDLTSAHVERDSLDRGKRIKGLHQILYMDHERILWPTKQY
jgi:hypothetical protein